jgi:hypothetical protein
MNEKLELRMVIISHLSDVQEIIMFGDKESAIKRINFVKMLVQKFDGGMREITESELNSEFERCNKIFDK